MRRDLVLLVVWLIVATGCYLSSAHRQRVLHAEHVVRMHTLDSLAREVRKVCR